jgi:HSP20 family protein
MTDESQAERAAVRTPRHHPDPGDARAADPRLAREREGLTVQPPVDIYETHDAVVLIADLPGVRPDGLEVTVHDGVLNVRGTIDPQVLGDQMPTRYERSFNLPEMIDQHQLHARLSDGVLHLEMPKRAESVPRKIQVEVKPRAKVYGS